MYPKISLAVEFNTLLKKQESLKNNGHYSFFFSQLFRALSGVPKVSQDEVLQDIFPLNH